MVICGQEFDFSALNADDMERVEIAEKHMQQADAIEQKRPKSGIADAIRGQCRLVMDFLDEVLGAGASQRLGLTGKDFGACREAMDIFRAAVDAEISAMTQHVQPANREQRRAQQKHKHKHGHGRKPQAVTFPAQAKPAAAQMVERVDKAARRKALLAELAALDD